MRQKAEDFAEKIDLKEFVATYGWFHRCRKRINVVFKRTYGEQNSADVAAANQWIEKEWRKLIASYDPRGVYNADESGLYYKAMPSHTYLFKGGNTKGQKVSKELVNILYCVSMTGEKKQLLAVGKSKRLRCFKGIEKLPFDFFANNSAWMTSVIFNKWLLKWGNQLNHKILLLIDNCTAHVLNVSLKHINAVFLAANMISLMQPWDQRIIRALKAYYRHETWDKMLESFRDNEEISANDLAEKELFWKQCISSQIPGI
ncbi:Tigger transposable element-derived protein 6 [Araneus ventricosus]|uniref:Tigger transposable element-derived protein 6 n=1 Tax=Araneus ventricosus TaxID=182803 RepID=A0A4Y2MXU2_ARAVE|nr:Tigger transposable element-derived protein 6 [Araneus ventricosus]